jgi:aminopeptidase
VELPEGHIWEAGDDVTLSGRGFVANMPTEELFTSPLRTGVNGVVYASMPLVESGNIIDKFRFVVKDGKIVEARAETGEEFLKAAISVDEGASYFGEVALVPYDSPISNQKILFYNTLFDENAACHIAFGEAYPCLEGGQRMTKEELKARGLNDSITHVDFMVGTADLSIVGTTQDGQQVPVFVDGNFAPGL